MNRKKKYDTAVVLLYLIGREDLLPQEFRKTIPYSTISSWRKADYTSYIGHEYRCLFIDRSDYLELKQKYEAVCAVLKSVVRAWVCLQPLLLPALKESRTNKIYQKQIVRAVGYLRNGLGLYRTLKLFKISRTLFNVWNDVAKKSCQNSQLSLCVKKYPRQLHKKEAERIKSMLTSPKWLHWPIVSIASLALRKKHVAASLFSWYKYARIFNGPRIFPGRKKPKIGLQSETPNEYLHIDSTYYALNENEKVCITFVMDNFSKMILGFSISKTLSFHVVKEALAEGLKIVAMHPDQIHPFLVADGGKENHNKEITEFIQSVSGFTITKIRALKDIKFSNSPVEAIHKIIKNKYLRNAHFDSIKSLNAFLEKAVLDYNQLRPHYKHAPRTPYEVYFGTSLGFDPHKRIMNAAKKRAIDNRKSACEGCKSMILKNPCWRPLQV